ncbi:MAG: RsmB/NOP family class I SAM-dependent RNA methyltransferase [Alphaproteobacteria bacterium]|nr:RsmB/NOP family class I SAM-dependent RNA methyltransferase [Alphaproteobacteria bacterium]
MQISAKYQAVLEIMQKVWQDQYPADNIIKEYMRARKYIGSKDRKFVTNTVWDIIRHRSRLEFDCGCCEPRMLLLTYLKDEDFDIIADGSEYGLAPLEKHEKEKLAHLNEDVYPEYIENECPKWLYEQIGNAALATALNTTAPADIRANFIGREEAKDKLQKEGLFFSLTPYSPYGLRSEERVNLQNCIAYQNGEIEVQDEASQLGAILCDVRQEHKIIDYCCGGGGKSLLLGAILKNGGTIWAHDKNKKRMEDLPKRAERLGIKNIKTVDNIKPSDLFDRFIIDAPCSGSGTWRRSPDAKYRLTPKQLKAIEQAQHEILEIAATHLTADGRIVYMTCSVLPAENEQQITAFLERHPEFETVDMEKLWERKLEIPYPLTEKRWLKCSPLTTNTDGFFVCVLHKK